MRILVFVLLVAAAAAAGAQPAAGPPNATVEALRRAFPAEHQALSESLAGKAPEEARRLAYAGIETFLRRHRDSILAAPGPRLVAIEARQGALLRVLARQDVALCARVGDRGFFSPEALAGADPAGLDDYGVALVEAARAGAGATGGTPPATKEDLLAWLAAVGRIAPDVPVKAMLGDPALRARSGPDHLCRGAAAMHEAVAALPADQGQRVARTLLRSVIGSEAP